MKAALLIIGGVTLSGVTFGAWYWLNALACGMNTTGCSNFHLNWKDWETLRFFLPPFLLGLGLIGAGLWVWLRP